jgi:midasin
MTTEGAQDNPMTEQSDQSSRRTLADALAEVQKRYQEIQTAIDHEPQQGNAHENRQSQIVEHVKEDAEDTRPALGHANEDEVANLRDLNIVDDVPDIEQDQDTQMYDDSIHQAPPVESSTHPANKLNEISLDRPHVDEEVERALTREDIRSRRDPREQTDLDAAFAIPSQNQLSMTSEEVEAQLIEWQSSSNRQEGVESIWRLYSSLTHELAWSLCEQLRLILEPTKATRLRGDYRTGKRLNMKKIIPYIASEYTKDKIWLRRTRPSQREYQVLLALDDSRSMSESHSEHLAFETLALVSKALTRLEAGDISVVKFGETVDILHGFDDGPFNDTVGAKVIGSFGFNQSSTDVLSLVETSLAVLQNARDKRGSSSSSNLWQLEIIVSDGICSNHEKLRSALRRAREQKIMVVFIIVDSLSRSASAGGAGDRRVQNSILSMKQVRADLSVERYLDTFPFEYYLVLRSVDALPEVLSGTLKQFFERIAEE